MMRSVLADVNVWLATLVAEHPHHKAAVEWWRTGVLARDNRVAFCRVTQLGVLRLLTNEQVMGASRMTIKEAWALYERVLDRDPVVFAREPERTEALLAEHCQLGGASRKFWTDGYLAAFARAGELSLATFDSGFRRYPSLDLELLSPAG